MSQQSFLSQPASSPAELVECLGMTFENDEARRAYFTEKLREKLLNPELRQIDGFPIGSDEDILALSDPPYYTACPNPFIEDFIRCYGKPYDPNEPYGKEPFAADVSEGKNDPIYNAHSYHTKVPHKAIMRYLLHYTKPGDIVLDGFCGTGMTGVAAQLCGNPDREFKATIEQEWEDAGWGNPEWGARRTILGDLSPAATFIAYNYNTSVDAAEFEHEARRILSEVETEYGWMYETRSNDGRKARVNYIVWSDVFICPNCSNEIVFFDVAVDSDQGKVHGVFNCPQCGVELTKNSIKRSPEYHIDYATSERFVRAKQIPVLVNITLSGKKSDKKPGDHDTFVLEKIEQLNINHWFPIERIDKDIDIWYERDYRSLGVYAIHHFFTKRNMTILAALWDKSNQLSDKKMRNRFKFALTGMQVNLSRMNRYRPNVSFPYNPLSGTLYIGSIPMESNVIEGIARKIERLKKASYPAKDELNITTTQSCSKLEQIPNDSIDYIFVDPPFGSNIIYSDLSIIWESWLKVSTETRSETVVHRRKQNDAHGIEDYTRMMFESFQQYFRVLKPGRWMTIEFSNTRAAVWNAIQVTLEQSGFVVANVAALDKQMGSFKAVTTPTAVKQDLVISCYKPNGGLEARFGEEQGSELGAWEFIRNHLRYLPVFLSKDGQAVEIVERTPRILYDRLVAYFVRHGYAVPLSAQEFQAGLLQRFPERDGMYFLSEQVAEYERKRLTVREIQQLQIFVDDESSAIQWVRQQLTNKPQTVSDLTPEFMKELKTWAKHEKLPELRQLLEENFLSYEGHGPIPAQVVSWMRKSADMRDLIRSEIDAGRAMEDKDALTTTNPRLIAAARDRWYVPDPNRAIDLEKLRLRGLLREFATYREGKGKLKLFRTEAVRAGFAQAYKEKDFATMVRVAERLPENVVQEDSELLMYYDTATLRMER